MKKYFYKILLILIFLKNLYGKVLESNEKDLIRIKRGYSNYGENDFVTSIQVTSGVLQFGSHQDETPSDSVAESSNANGWLPSQSAASSDVWLDPSQLCPDPQPPMEPGSIFSTDNEMPASGVAPIRPVSVLHTQIISSSGVNSGNSDNESADLAGAITDNGGVGSISDNIDFNNIADMKSKHYTKSYGK